MTKVIIFNKPYGVICQFSPDLLHPTLKDYIPIPGIYPAGRLDSDSEGLVILTNNGQLQSQITEPKYKKFKTYLVQVDGVPNSDQLNWLRQGVELSQASSATKVVASYRSSPACVKVIDEPEWLWERQPPIRVRKNLATTWLELAISEGKNRQVRRMTAKVGLPTLRLVRSAVGGVQLDDLQPGQWRAENYAEFIQQLNLEQARS